MGYKWEENITGGDVHRVLPDHSFLLLLKGIVENLSKNQLQIKNHILKNSFIYYHCV